MHYGTSRDLVHPDHVPNTSFQEAQQFTVRGQTTRVPHLVHPRRGHQGRQFL